VCAPGRQLAGIRPGRQLAGIRLGRQLAGIRAAWLPICAAPRQRRTTATEEQGGVLDDDRSTNPFVLRACDFGSAEIRLEDVMKNSTPFTCRHTRWARPWAVVLTIAMTMMTNNIQWLVPTLKAQVQVSPSATAS